LALAGGDGGVRAGGSGRALRDAHPVTPPASWRGPRLSRDNAVAKMGHPAFEDEPKLETFPAVSQKANIVGSLGDSSDGKLAAIARGVSPETLAAYQQLRSAQSGPIDIAAIEIMPLQ
jgi:hypothetical protein